jgi:hypothetical protein
MTYRDLRRLITQRSLVQIQPPQPIKTVILKDFHFSNGSFLV